MQLFEIIFEEEDLLVINKPAGLVCHPTKTDEYSSLIGRVRLHCGPGIRPHLVNRLDRETSGVVIVAKNPEAAGQLGKLWESRAVEKEYLALVHGRVEENHGLIEAALGKDEGSRIAIKDCVRPDGTPALTEFWTELRFSRPDAAFPEAREPQLTTWKSSLPNYSLLRVVPRTGRKHQIRIHLAHLGHPIVGDKLYGGDEDLYLALVEDRLTAEQHRRLLLPNQALHARSVRFSWRGKDRRFEAEPEPSFRQFLAQGVPQES